MGLLLRRAEFTARYPDPLQSQVRPGLLVELLPRFPALLVVALPASQSVLTGTLGAVTGPAAGEPAPHGVEAAPGICAHFSQLTGARAKQELAQEPVDGIDVIPRPPRPECRI